MKYYKITCHLDEKDLELIANFFFKIGSLGNEIMDNSNEFVDFFGEIYPVQEKKDFVTLIGYFHKVDSRHIYDFINKYQLEVDVQVEREEEPDYESLWKKNFKEIMLNDKISIIPSWFDIENNDKIYVKIEPGLGFGTGSHPSTRLALLNLIKFIQNIKSLIDVGCGSGIISILGKKLNIKEVYGLDLDKNALKNSQKNASINGCYDIKFLNCPLSKLNIKVDMIVANLTYSILLDHLKEFKYHLNYGGVLIISGLLVNEADNMIQQLKLEQYDIIHTLNKDNWVSLVAVYKFE